jgi:hypothetical protein
MRAFQGPLGARSLKSHRGPPTPPEGADGVLTGPCCVGSSPGRVAYKSHATKATAARAAKIHAVPAGHLFRVRDATPAGTIR